MKGKPWNLCWPVLHRCAWSMALAAGCYPPAVDDDYLAEDALQPPAEQFGGEPAIPPVCEHEDPSPLSSLYFQVRTSTLGGRFAPRNVGAIWVERADESFVETLKLWGHTRIRWLERFQTASEGDAVDAITGPTLVAHETHEIHWDMVDASGCEIDNGEYNLVVEVTDRSGSGDSQTVPFTKMTEPWSETFPDSLHFHDMQLVLK